MTSLRIAASLGMIAVAGCTARVTMQPSDIARLPFRVDSARTEQLAAGVVHRYVYVGEGPWAIHMFEVPRNGCADFRAVKANRLAVGRQPATLLLEQLNERERVIGGVNADYFNLTNGVPVGVHVEGGRVIAGPSDRSVFAVDSSGAPFIGVLRTSGSVTIGGMKLPVAGWNRIIENGLSVLDRAWGTATDSASGRVELVLEGPSLWMKEVDTLARGMPIPPAGMLVVAGRNAPAVKRQFEHLLLDEHVQVEHAIQPAVRDAVGGWQVMLRDGQVTAEADSGATNGPVRHPRTAAAIFPDGHVMLLVVDGRQKPYSDGMTLREVARVFQSLGAREAINLDGGGSSTFVVRDAGGVMRIQNQPSDKTERPVSNVLAIVNKCAR